MAIERYSTSVVSIIGWGRRISRKEDPIVERALEMMHTAAQIFVPGDYWMETLPILQYLPSWIYALPSRLRMGKDAVNSYWYALSKEGSESSEQMCFSRYVLQFEQQEGLRPEEIAGLTGNLIGGGVVCTIISAWLILGHYDIDHAQLYSCSGRIPRRNPHSAKRDRRSRGLRSQPRLG